MHYPRNIQAEAVAVQRAVVRPQPELDGPGRVSGRLEVRNSVKQHQAIDYPAVANKPPVEDRRLKGRVSKITSHVALSFWMS